MTAPAAPLGPLRAATERWGRGSRRRGATAVRFGDAPRVAIIPAHDRTPDGARRTVYAIRAEGDAVDYARTLSPARARQLAIKYARLIAEALA